MRTFIYVCPLTRERVQGWVAEETKDTYQAVTCLRCQRVHHVNPDTGEVAGSRT